MHKILTTLALALLAPFLFAVPAVAEPGVPTWPGETSTDCYSQADVDVLELHIATLEHDNARLRATLEEERDEHADELRDLDRRAWALQQAHDAEVNELSAAIRDGEQALSEERVRLSEADARNIRQRATIQRLRAKIRALR